MVAGTLMVTLMVTIPREMILSAILTPILKGILNAILRGIPKVIQRMILRAMAAGTLMVILIMIIQREMILNAIQMVILNAILRGIWKVIPRMILRAMAAGILMVILIMIIQREMILKWILNVIMEEIMGAIWRAIRGSCPITVRSSLRGGQETTRVQVQPIKPEESSTPVQCVDDPAGLTGVVVDGERTYPLPDPLIGNNQQNHVDNSPNVGGVLEQQRPLEEILHQGEHSHSDTTNRGPQTRWSLTHLLMVAGTLMVTLMVTIPREMILKWMPDVIMEEVMGAIWRAIWRAIRGSCPITSLRGGQEATRVKMSAGTLMEMILNAMMIDDEDD
ncbi:uncharacterized protein [Labrus bergylta]|uniref:uncharacterized protein n=1 Tax=Labrus bergylta TaxID=56723 RepID=UPI003313FE04